MIKKRLSALTLALAMLFTLAACGGEMSSGSAHPIESGTSVSETPDCHIFIDDAGREVVVPDEITRIVPSAPLAQIILYAIAPEMFVGAASRWDDSAHGIIDEAHFELPYFGSLYASAELNVEELALANPQLIIDVGEAKDSVKETLDTLQAQTNIPSVYLSATLETMPDTYRKLGKLLDKEKKGEELALFCERIYKRTVSIMERVGSHKVKTLYVIGEKGLNVLAAGSYHAEVLDMLTSNMAVMENPMSKGLGNEVSMEQIALWNPEFVIFAPDSIYDTVQDMSPWNQTTAVVNGDYVEAPDAPLNWLGMPPSVQRYLSLIWLTAELYPSYCDYDVKADVLEYYALFYGCQLTDAQYEEITATAFRR